MPLHLLHHKSYHVYSAENIARVRRDEVDAAAREAAEDARMQAADAEARMKLLRERAREGGSAVAAERGPERGALEQTARHIETQDHRPRQPLEGGILGADGHINLFPAPTAPQGGNPEREREKREEKERAEGAMGKAVGERRPWYSTVDLVSGRQREKEKDGRKSEWEGKRDDRRKEAGDPLGVIRRGVREVKEARRDREEWKRRREREVGGAEARGWQDGRDEKAERIERADRGGRDSGRKRRRRSFSRSGGGSPNRHDRSHKRHSHSHSRSVSHSQSRRHRHHRDDPGRHSHHHHSRSHHRGSGSDSGSRSISPNPTLESLRKEKLQRESAERQKASLLLAKAQADSEPGWKPVPGGRYSSQFGNRPG
ncbi:unnamed protein product [Tuber melanosporum]|uniref:(Perigord truffle) hypothetical protein n=1 Tax=Tuber melanosporum (strain Mel28) TaxID=656061 RepID=D5GEY6_TUBMM|nr:uncharacterized protein GSTUM_00006659001 [Tuber melanosporum]CAZ83079.1 unnamed protein product [Tuber melanosporum]